MAGNMAAGPRRTEIVAIYALLETWLLPVDHTALPIPQGVKPLARLAATPRQGRHGPHPRASIMLIAEGQAARPADELDRCGTCSHG